MPQGGARGQILGHLKKSFFFIFFFLLCNQAYLKNSYYSGLTWSRTGTIYRYIDASRYGLGRYAYRYAWCRIAILLEIRLSINLAHFLPQNKF